MKKFAVLGLLFPVVIASTPAFAADAVIAPANNNNNAVAVPTGPEAADHTERASSFGHGGQILVGASTNALLGGQFATGANAFQLEIAPRAAYFITDTVFIGGLFELGYRNSNDVSQTTFAIGPTAGLHFPLGNNFSAIPSLTLALGINSFSGSVFASQTATTFNIDLDGAFAWHVVPHFSFTFGPYFHQTVGDATVSSLGVNFGVLGWI